MTQRERILEYMKQNDGITSMDAYRLGCTRLAARIADLKKDGHRITTIKRKALNGAWFAEYRLEKGEE